MISELMHSVGSVWTYPAEALTSEGVKELRRLYEENSKLRKVVRGLWYCNKNEGKAKCEGCPLGIAKGDRPALGCEKMMDELRIEV